MNLIENVGLQMPLIEMPVNGTVSSSFQGQVQVDYVRFPANVPLPPSLVRIPPAVESSAPIDTRLSDILNRIQRLALLETNWDSMGSPPPTFQARLIAKGLIEQIAQELGDTALPENVVPLSGGGVQVHWAGKAGELELEISPKGQFGYLLIQGSDAERESKEADDVSAKKVLELISSVVS